MKEIRREALLFPLEVEWEGKHKIMQPLVKGEDKFLWLMKNGIPVFPKTSTEAAQHIWRIFGKDWRKYVTLKREARATAKSQDLLYKLAAQQRDKAWVYIPPNLDGLAYLHAHTLNGDRAR